MLFINNFIFKSYSLIGCKLICSDINNSYLIWLKNFIEKYIYNMHAYCKINDILFSILVRNFDEFILDIIDVLGLKYYILDDNYLKFVSIWDILLFDEGCLPSYFRN